MSLQDCIVIDTVYTRSINLERDIDSAAIVEAYIPTTRSLYTLRKLANTFNKNNTPRSWALIGPYGSGKSSFAVYLSHLLYGTNDNNTERVFSSLANHSQGLIEKFINYTDGTKGFVSILLTGSPDPLIPRFLLSLQKSVYSFWRDIPGPPPTIIAKIDEALQEGTVNTHQVIGLVEMLRQAVEKAGGAGVLIVFDELGKFLEYEARHYEANDIYLLQSLAELAVTGHKTNIYVFTLMHQGFEQYARGLGEDLRNEWSKIQGRFENIPFLESTEQTLHIISRAFKNRLTERDKDRIATNCKKIAAVLDKEKALPGGMHRNLAADLFAQCYPLHPVSVLLLPILCQKMAQNERTLFSYLGSKEQHGLRYSLSAIDKIGEWVMPWEIFDYFILNQPSVLTDPITHRRWAEVITAIERLGDVPTNYFELLKTIGLLNIIGAQGGFKASKKIISLCATSKRAATMAANGLIESAVLQFRKFSNEYRVWQGSDFDLDAAIKDELDQMGYFELCDELNKRKPLQPIVARRHTIETGSLRYFSPSFVDVNTYRKKSNQAGQERIVFCLVESAEEINNAYDKVVPYFSAQDVVGIYRNGVQLREAVAEVIALHRVENKCQEVNSDPVAQREFKDRLAVAEQLEDELLSALLETPQEAEWFWRQEKLTVTGKREHQQKLSTILDAVYRDTPYIHNELINREKPSAQANAARNKLVMAMINHLDEPELGIKKFPPEKAIYLAFLYSTGLHQQRKDGCWELKPPSRNNKCNLYPVWQEIDEFLESTKSTPRSFDELTIRLRVPPFGIKAGLLPLLYLTVFLAKQHELALYENSIYTPYITTQHIERFMKKPSCFTVQLLQIAGIRASLFQEYAKVLFGRNNKQEATLHTIAKPLAKFVANLDEYAKRTNRISPAGKKVRKAIQLAKSPTDLLFVKLPNACGFPAVDNDDIKESQIEGFAASLVEAIRELRDCHKKMLNELQELIAHSLLPDMKRKLELSELRSKLCATYEDLDQYTIDHKELIPFIEHLSESKAKDELWFNRLLLFLAGRSSEKWRDIDRDNALKKLTDLSRRLLDLNFLQSSYKRQKIKIEGDFDVIWLRTMRHGTNSDCDELVRIDETAKEYISKNKKQLKSLLQELGDESTRLAMLAELLDDTLVERKKNKIKKRQKPKRVNE
ncbi:MAG: hypothetical protein WGN25_06195 [Candidatus Electrothrix sp. GW3-4]|uniref:hypothetical protein n=1 Tax=Candidatus Electrothrix sp. GW3-4 TaxID=3126740 RepID=UPI0030D4BB85